MTGGRSKVVDLLLGVDLAFRGARLRTALTAIGLGLAVTVLLIAAAIPHALSAQKSRFDGRSTWDPNSNVVASPTSALAAPISRPWRGSTVEGVLLQADGANPPVPPGVSRWPAPGEAVVSPALAKLLAQPESEPLREAIGGRIVGQIARSGLSGPAELLWYRGTNELRSPEPSTGRVIRFDGFGSTSPASLGGDLSTETFLSILVIAASIALLLPIAILVATAARFGSERRDRRLAALRLLGCSAARTARIAAGESLAGGLAGLAIGAALFTGVRVSVEHINWFGLSLYASDLTPTAWLTALVAVAVLLTTVGSTLIGLRRVAIEPLGVMRRALASQRRRFWWRLVPGVAGGILLAPYLGSNVDVAAHFLRITVGVTLSLLMIVALLPWAIEVVVRWMRPWSVSSQLALRSLQQDPSSASRIVAGLAVAVAGAITLQTLLTLTASRDAEGPGDPVRSSATIGGSTSGTLADMDRLRVAIANTPGVERSAVVGAPSWQQIELASTRFVEVTLGSCADLRTLGVRGACNDATSVFRLIDRSAPQYGEVRRVAPSGGDLVRIPSGEGGRLASFTVPRDVSTQAAIANIVGAPRAGILATPAALERQGVRVPRLSMDVSAWLDPSDPSAPTRFANTLARFDPLSSTYDRASFTGEDVVPTLKRWLLAGATLLLALTGASLLVTALEQLGGRRRTLATLAAAGVPRSVLRRALLLRTGLPVAIGLVLSVGIGASLGAALLAMQHETVRFDPSGMLTVVTIAVMLLGLVSAATLPLLARASSPAAMRTE